MNHRKPGHQPGGVREPGRSWLRWLTALALVVAVLLPGCAARPSSAQPTTVPAVLDRVVTALTASHPGARVSARPPHDGAVAARTVWIAGRPADIEVFPTTVALQHYIDTWQGDPGTLRCLQTGPHSGPGPSWSVDTTDEATARAVDDTLTGLGHEGGFLRDDERPQPPA